MIWLRSLLYLLFMYLSTLVFALTVAVVGAFGHRVCYPVAVRWAIVNLWVLDKLCGLRFEVEGTEHIPLEPCVLYWKHESVFEIMAGLVIFPRQTWVVKRELMWLPVFGWGMYFMRPIAINRKARRSAVKQVMAQGQQLLAEGISIVIYPEGTRVLPGQSKRFGISGAALAKAASRPLVPVAHNTGDFWPRRSILKKPGTIRVVIGAPIDTADASHEEITRQARDWIAGEIERISPNRIKSSAQS